MSEQGPATNNDEGNANRRVGERVKLRDLAITAAVTVVVTTILNLIFSREALQGVVWMFGSSVLPPHAIILVNGDDCGGGAWKPLANAAGRFLVSAGHAPDNDKMEFKADVPLQGRTAVTLTQANLPAFDVAIQYQMTVQNLGDNHNDRAVRWIYPLKEDATAHFNETADVHVGGQSAPIDITPPSYGVIPCQRQ
jgi:hypothetical protein